MKLLFPLLCSLVLVVTSSRVAAAAGITVQDVVTTPSDFPLVANSRAAAIVVDPGDAEVVRLAAGLFAEDVERVTRVRPGVVLDAVPGKASAYSNTPLVLIGTVGQSRGIDDLIRRGKLDARAIQGKWESFVIATVADAFPGGARALVIAGSDRRGTAFGVFEVSAAVGVSPWAWWAEVPPQPRAALVIAGGTHVEGPPSVKYRGIFINDEDWGLQPWAEKTFEPETGDIGPKTYARIFELLLRLKANYCWPAMHDCTKAFNHYPENKVVADRYAIVMGSSHCEQMLRNNVDEWDQTKSGEWNPVTNLPRVLDYWETRVRENGRFESVYTTGMRGIHDGDMPGGGTLEEKRERLEHIIGLQREMLARHVHPDPSRVPQIFCPYKEVLNIYQAGLDLPDDITIVWPDDNHGYVRQLPDARERRRAGGHGVYYHISYWGRPHDYLWLDSTAPALIWHEMTKAHAFAARELWVVNVGDVKSIETGMTFFLQLAWDVERYDEDAQLAFLRDFYRQQFGPGQADAIAALRDEYYRLCAIRRPEHMGFNGVYPNTPVQNSGWSPAESAQFLERWREVERRAKAVAAQLPEPARDAYFQLVEYPASGGAAMAEKMLLAERARLTGSPDAAAGAQAAFERLQRLTARYNATGNGKWTGIMHHQPRGLAVFDLPPTTPQPGGEPAAEPSESKRSTSVTIDPAGFVERRDEQGAGWRVIEGLGPRGRALAVLPHRDTPTRLSPAAIAAHSPMLAYRVEAAKAGAVDVVIDALPTHRLTPAHEVVAAVSINDEAPVLVRFDQGVDDEHDPSWQRNVLRNAMYGRASLHVPQGAYTLKLWAADCGVVVQGITLAPLPGPDDASR